MSHKVVVSVLVASMAFAAGTVSGGIQVKLASNTAGAAPIAPVLATLVPANPGSPAVAAVDAIPATATTPAVPAVAAVAAVPATPAMYVATFNAVPADTYTVSAQAIDDKGGALSVPVTGNVTVAPDAVQIDVPASMSVTVS